MLRKATPRPGSATISGFCLRLAILPAPPRQYLLLGSDKSTLGAFFPIFGNGDTLAAVVISSIGIWIFHFTVLRGVQQAATINKIVTVAKVLPIILFILILAVSFKGHLFAANFWGGEGMPASGILIR